MTTQVSTVLSFKGYNFEIGKRNVGNLIRFMEIAETADEVKKFIQENYGDCRITEAEAPREIPEIIHVPPREINWKERPPRTGLKHFGMLIIDIYTTIGDVPFPKLPELKPEHFTLAPIEIPDKFYFKQKEFSEETSHTAQENYAQILLEKANKIVDQLRKNNVPEKDVTPLLEQINKFSQTVKESGPGTEARTTGAQSLESLLKKYMDEYKLH